MVSAVLMYKLTTDLQLVDIDRAMTAGRCGAWSLLNPMDLPLFSCQITE